MLLGMPLIWNALRNPEKSDTAKLSAIDEVLLRHKKFHDDHTWKALQLKRENLEVIGTFAKRLNRAETDERRNVKMPDDDSDQLEQNEKSLRIEDDLLARNKIELAVELLKLGQSADDILQILQEQFASSRDHAQVIVENAKRHPRP